MKWSKKWNKVTPFSKALAMILFILFPIIAFYLGIKYQKLVDKSLYPTVTNYVITPTPYPTKNQVKTCQTNSDCSANEQCLTSGPIVYNPKTKTSLTQKYCVTEGKIIPH